MALSASEVYHLTGDQLRQKCSELGLSDSGPVPVRTLRSRLMDYIKSGLMDRIGDQDTMQASVPTDLVHKGVESAPPTHIVDLGSHGRGDSSQTPVLVELLHQVAPLSSEEPEDMLWLFVRLGEIQALGLVDDRMFITRVLPLVSGSLWMDVVERTVSPDC
jgi:hypothetical protein